MKYIVLLLLIVLMSCNYKEKNTYDVVRSVASVDVSASIDPIRKCYLEDVSQAGIGDVKYSLLSVEMFQKVNGAEWILLAGQENGLSFSNDQYNIFKLMDSNNYEPNKLPNAAGYFLRGRNYFGGVNPESLKLGQPQQDAFQGHAHDVSIKFHKPGGGGGTPLGDDNQKDFVGWNIGAKTVSIVDDGTNGPTRFTVETRPKSITMNIFIKVARKCVDKITANLNDRLVAVEEIFKLTDCGEKTCEVNMALQSKYSCYKDMLAQYEAGKKLWSVGCLSRTVKILRTMLTQSKYGVTDDVYYDQLIQRYPEHQ